MYCTSGGDSYTVHYWYGDKWIDTLQKSILNFNMKFYTKNMFL